MFVISFFFVPDTIFSTVWVYILFGTIPESTETAGRIRYDTGRKPDGSLRVFIYH